VEIASADKMSELREYPNDDLHNQEKNQYAELFID